MEKCLIEKFNVIVSPQDLILGKNHLNIIFCSDLFVAKNCLALPSNKEIKISVETEKEREQKLFTHWINSLGLKEVLVNYLIDDLKTGKVLLKVIERLRPGSVDWEKRYTNKLNSRIHIIQNCNYVLELCSEKLGMKHVNIGGVDIVDGKVNLVMGLVWQLCKVYWE